MSKKSKHKKELKDELDKLIKEEVEKDMKKIRPGYPTSHPKHQEKGKK